MNFSIEKDHFTCYKWYTKQATFEVTHNYRVSPKKSIYFWAHKNLDDYRQRMLDLNDRTCIQMNKNFNTLVDVGGYENFEFGKKNLQNFINKAWYLRLGIGCGETFSEYFDTMREINDDFVYVMNVDDKFRVINVF